MTRSLKTTTLIGRSVFGRNTMAKLIDYDEAVADDLCDPEFAALLLANALLGDDPTTEFLCSLRRVVKARANMSEVARELSASRSSLYKALSEKGNPELATVLDVLDAVGLKLTVIPKAA